MELALYCPVYGYYEMEKDRIGQRGDFYTSVSVGSLFGDLLAFQFAEWLDQEETGHQEQGVQLVESGAHDGKLAADILRWSQRQRPQLYERLEYVIIEPSAHHREWQRKTLREFEPRVRWRSELPNDSRFHGIIFSNELLDAMPVHRLGWDAKQKSWFEWGVALDGERFVWTRMPDKLQISNFKSPILALPEELLEVLPDGFTTEICPAAENWWRDAANSLASGKLLTLDYGLNAEEFFAPQRAQGTLRAYHWHRLSDDVLANAGEQDITAHVNFTAIQKAGESVGLKTETLVSQAQFLTGIAERIWRSPESFGGWTAQHTHQFQTLTHPEHLGRAFRVLIQSR